MKYLHDKHVFALPVFPCLRISVQWMDDLSTRVGFFYNFCFTCKKGSVKANRTKLKNGNTLQ